MNIVFYILVLIVALGCFGTLSSVFEKIGNVAIRCYENIINNINEKDGNEDV